MEAKRTIQTVTGCRKNICAVSTPHCAKFERHLEEGKAIIPRRSEKLTAPAPTPLAAT